MKRRIHHRCGHDETHDVKGSQEEREKRLRWLKTVSCLSCWKKAQDMDARMESASEGMPTLRGTPNQCSWAERIRAQAIQELYRIYYLQPGIPDTSADSEAPATTDPLCSSLEEALQHLGRPEYASWWIERRTKSVSKMITELMQSAFGI